MSANFVTHQIIPGIELLVSPDVDEDRVDEVIYKARAIALGRTAVIERIKECVDILVENDNDETTDIVLVSECVGWHACRCDVTAEQYRLVIFSVLETLDNDQLAVVLQQAEGCIPHAAGGAS